MYRSACSVLLGCILAAPLAGQTTITLSPAAIPASGQPGITSVTLTGSNFPAGTILPQNVTVTLSPSGPGTSFTTQATSVMTVVGATRRVTFLIPAVISVTVPSVYQVSISSGGPISFTSGSTWVALTVNPSARIISLTPNSATAGQSLPVSIAGQYNNFLNGITQARFGAGISVGGAAAGGYGPVLVTSPTSAVAQLVIYSAAAPGPRTVDIQTRSELATLPAGFAVTLGPPPPPAVVTLNAVTGPATALPGDTVTVTGTGFPTESINAEEITVYLNPAPGAATTYKATMAASVYTPAGGGAGQVSFQIPPAIRFSADTAFQVSISGKTTLGKLFSSGNTAALTIAATSGRLLTVSPASGYEGGTLAVTVTGQFTNLQGGATQASFGAGISVGGGMLGGFGPVTVIDSNTVSAAVGIDASAAPGARAVTVKTGAEQASLPGGFTVLCSYTLSPANLSMGATGGSGTFGIATGSACLWTASTTATWITITPVTQGTGNGSVSFNVLANTTGATRSGMITAGGQTFTITQGAFCVSSINPGTTSFPAAGASGATLQVFAPAGCAWNTNTPTADWIHIRSATASGSGNGEVIYDLDANLGASQRTGTITVERWSHFIAQAAGQTFACGASAGPLKTARAGGLTEQLSDVVLTCTGDSTNSLTGDIVVTLNTNVGSKSIDVNNGVDALLLVNEPATPALGTNAFLGTLAGPNLVQFADVPIAAAGANSATFRITNLRGDASLFGVQQTVLATVGIQSATAVPVTNPQLAVAVVAPGLFFSRGTPSVSGAQTNLTLTYVEAHQSAFKSQIEESGFVNTAAFGDQVGTAASGTRLLARIRHVPANVRVFAPVYPNGNTGAQLVAQDDNGLGIGFVTGVPMFGGVYQEVAFTNGSGSATWEVVTANPSAIETLNLDLVILNATPADLAAITFEGMLAPLGVITGGVSRVPLFRDPSAPVPGPILR